LTITSSGDRLVGNCLDGGSSLDVAPDLCGVLVVVALQLLVEDAIAFVDVVDVSILVELATSAELASLLLAVERGIE